MYTAGTKKEENTLYEKQQWKELNDAVQKDLFFFVFFFVFHARTTSVRILA